MPRSSHSQRSGTGRRAVRHDRHGRAGRSSVTGPHLPPLRGRVDFFDLIVGSTADFLRGMWSEELENVSFEIGGMPLGEPGPTGVRRWDALRDQRRIILYRVPIERLARLHVNDQLHRQMHIESCVFRATAEYLERDPWDLGPERFR
ncbi:MULTISPECIES: metallopeptidase family protein [Mycetocola]|uniref:Metallopeptidase family protein n=1 Tax=Mycetocola lacteus TaxID=76637 RepID=A0A3L7AHF1_9MICO|nr:MULTISPECIES: metallopeptidase family protein [Mycetocola]MCS4276761.1 hypothetical protein [Mycetocola sp. BIGb0189]RLP79799.1 metallopeptidase family protein [Mycetocola lacteus]